MFCSYGSQSQNLVNNGYFENYYLDTTLGINTPNGWYRYASPDYYNVALGNVPYSLNYQADCCGGQAYVGEYMMCSFTVHSDDSCREYLETKLMDTLKTGHKYLSSMYVNKADMNYSIATVAMLFTDTFIPPPPYPQYVVIGGNPQVKNIKVITDTSNWILVQDTFIANGHEVYVTLGNFNVTATSDTVKAVGSWAYSGSSYYYIDGVSVYDVTGGACNSYWDAGFDKYIFAGDSIRLGAIDTDNSTYTWTNSIGGNTYLTSNSDARPWSSPSLTTTYYVTKTCPDNTVFNDTITVFVTDTNTMKVGQSSIRAIKIFPNPASNKVYVQGKQSTGIRIFDLPGKEMLRTKEEEIDINDLPNGIYFISVQTAAGTAMQKIVIQH